MLPPGRTRHGVSHPAALAAASPGGGDECLEEDEDELEPGLDEAEAEPEAGSGAKAAGGTRGAVLTRRGITLRVLLRDGLLEPARGVLSIYYLVSRPAWGHGTGTGMGNRGPAGASPAHPVLPRARSSWGTWGRTGPSPGRRQGRSSTRPAPGPPTASAW